MTMTTKTALMFVLLAMRLGPTSAWAQANPEVREPFIGGAGVTPPGVGEVMPLIRAVPLPGTWPYGLASDGASVWHVDSDTDRLYELAPASGAVLSTGTVPGTHATGLDYYAGAVPRWRGLWMADYDSDRIHLITPGGHSIPAPAPDPDGIAWLGDELLVASWATGLIHKVDPDTGQVLSSIPAPGNSIRGMTPWQGKLWVVDSGFDADRIFRLEPATGEVLGVYRPEPLEADDYICGLTVVNDELWVVSKYDQEAWVVVPEPALLGVLALGALAMLRRRRAERASV